MSATYNFDPASAFHKIEAHMTKWAADTRATNFVVGLSGGKDSTVVAMLLTAIFGPERVYGVMLPSGVQSDIQDSKDVARILGINHHTINIGEANASILNQLEYVTTDCKINLPARLRMATLFAFGQCIDGRVINTCNLSEDMCGYATLFGDNAGTYAPIQGLTVTEVKELGKWLAITKILYPWDATEMKRAQEGKNHSDCDRLIGLIDKTPVDGLQPLSDEERLGFTYASLDNFIRKNEGSDEFKSEIREIYAANKFKLDIVRMEQPEWNYPNFVIEQ